jgi:hypothetical protein
VQVWQAGQTRVLHGVTVAGEALQGTPFHLPLECDSCQLSIPLAEIDSLRTGGQEKSALFLIMAPLVAVGLAVFFIRVGSDWD